MNAEGDDIVFPDTTAQAVVLPNGLEVIVKEDHSAPVASLQAWCRTGSIHEGDCLGSGLSHFLEHMLFKGTRRRDAGEIAKAVQREGGYINAYTSFDRTVYWIDAPAEGVEACLDVLCDVAGFATLPEEEFSREREVIHREIAMSLDNPAQVLGTALFRTAYAVHPCRHPVIGHLDLFDQLTPEDLRRYYAERYSPDNLFFVIAGAVDSARIVEGVASRLGELTRRRHGPATVPDEPPQMGLREERISFPTDLSRIRLAWPGPDGSHPDVPTIDLAMSLLGSGRSSRLHRAVREEQRLAHSVGAYGYTPSFPGQLVLSLDTAPDKAEAAEAAVFSEVDRLLAEGVREEELQKAKKRTLSEQFATLSDMRGQASDLGANWLLTRSLDYTRDYVRAVQAVSREDLHRVAAKYLATGRFTRVTMDPHSEKGAAPPRAASLRSEEFRKVELENGLTLLLLADRRLPFVHAAGVFRGGLLAESAATGGATRLMARLLTKDTARRPAAELAELVESAGGGISSSCGGNSFGVHVHAMRPDLRLVSGLLAESLLEPAFSPEDVDKEKEFQIARIKTEADFPFTVAMKRLRRELYGTHPYGLEPGGTEESVAALGREEVAALHRRLVKGGNGVAGLFGDLDLDEAEDLLRAGFEGALAPGEREFTRPLGIALPDSGAVAELRHDKEQAVLLVGYRTVDLAHPDDAVLDIIDEACSDMASRLFLRIREELGLAYSVGATRLPGLEPGFLAFYASTSPEHLERVEEEMSAEIASIVSGGLSEEELSRARASWLGRELIDHQAVQELASSATVDELVGLGWDHYRRAPERIRSITREETREVAARHFREDNRAVVRLSPAG